MEWAIGLISGAFGAALIAFAQFLIARHDKKKEAESVERKALRYLMLYVIMDTGKDLLRDGSATMEEKKQRMARPVSQRTRRQRRRGQFDEISGPASAGFGVNRQEFQKGEFLCCLQRNGGARWVFAF